jgi:hypothetical protein
MALAPASAGEAQDPHLGWLVEYYAERARVDTDDNDDMENPYALCHEIQDRILDTEPTTLAGVAAQLMMIT